MVSLFTIGHSNHPIEQFLELLRQHGIRSLADIRRFPGSRTHPHFNRESLEAALNAQGIDYRWIEELGGRRGKASPELADANLGLRNQFFRNYANYMQGETFQQGVAVLLVLARKQPTAMMCAEGLWWRCHRRLVSDHLVANDISVLHIFPNGTLKPHVMTSGAKSAGGQVTYPGDPFLFDSMGFDSNGFDSTGDDRQEAKP